MTKEELEKLEAVYKGDVSARWDELLEKYRHRLNLKNIDAEEEERLRIILIVYPKRTLFSDLEKFESLQENEKEVFEIYRIKYSGNFVIILGPISQRREFKVFSDIEI